MWGFVVCMWDSSDWQLGWTHVGPVHHEKDQCTGVLGTVALNAVHQP